MEDNTRDLAAGQDFETVNRSDSWYSMKGSGRIEPLTSSISCGMWEERVLVATPTILLQHMTLNYLNV